MTAPAHTAAVLAAVAEKWQKRPTGERTCTRCKALIPDPVAGAGKVILTTADEFMWLWYWILCKECTTTFWEMMVAFQPPINATWPSLERPTL